MKHLSRLSLILVCVLLIWADTQANSGPGAVRADDVEALYLQYCGECHGPDRLGRVGPALLPENLGRLDKKAAVPVIRDGRPATQMPPFADKLDEEQIERLVDLIYRPLPETPR